MSKKIKRLGRWVLLLVLLISFFTLLAFTVVPTRTEAQPYKVGVIVGLTGGGSAIGRAMWQGAELAIEQINAKGGIGGRMLEGIAEDSAWAPDPAVEALTRLTAVGHVQAFVIGGSTSLQACVPIVTRNKVAVTNPGAQSPALAGASPYIFHVIPLGDYDIRVISRYVYKELGLRRIAITYVNNDTGRYNRREFDKEFTALGGKIVEAESFEQNATDFGVQLAKVRSANPDGIYLAATPTECPFVVKQAREMGINVQFFSWATVETPEMIKIAGKAAEGLIYTATFLDLKSTKEPVASFVKTYRARWKEDPTIYAAYGYDCAMILAEGIKRAGYDGAGIAKVIHEVRTFEGVSGTTTFRQDGTSIKPVSIKQIRNGQFVAIGTLKAE